MKLSIRIGMVYRVNGTGELTRIFRGGSGDHFSGRGCTKQTAVPYNHYRPHELEEATRDEIEDFLEAEVENGMCQTWNK